MLRLKRKTDFVEVSFHRGRATLVSGDPGGIQEILIEGQSVWQ